MTKEEIKKGIKEGIKKAIERFATTNTKSASENLLTTLGYRSNKKTNINLDTLKRRASDRNISYAQWDELKSAELIFQLTDDEVKSGNLLFNVVNEDLIQSYLFFAVELSGKEYSRGQLSRLTRSINRLYDMPVMIFFHYGNFLTVSVINRRLHKRDESKDVLEKVTQIKNINIASAHRAHIDILFDLSFDELKEKHEFTNFVGLHDAWEKTLDSSELNERFYKELANWYFWAVDNVEFPNDVEKDREKRNSINVIRMLTRLIFVWFLKEKDNLIPDELFNKNKLDKFLDYKDKTGSTYYKAILQNLFFATLNTEMNKYSEDNNKPNRSFVTRQYGVQEFYRYKRFFKDKEAAFKLFENIPFLNGGLFENLDRNVGEKDEVRIDCFSNLRDNEERLKIPDYLFFETEKEYNKLNKIYDTTGKKYVVRGLIEILNKYKFTIHENTPIEEEIALDPELLGKVFENLLASYNEETKTTARKLTGSFYTPREVVNYMVEESLIAYLKNILTEKGSVDVEEKLRDLFSYNESEPQFTEEEQNILIEAIDKCKIVDPACGSGAFPMGILHKMVFILGKLDPYNERWKQRQIDKVYDIPDTTLHDNLKTEIEKAFTENFNDYGRKLYLIENCIYGVDIQPIAAQIAKLRFFISLIVDQKVDRKANNLGIRPLPNLETKFVAANTLIGIERPHQLSLRNEQIDVKEKQLRDVRERHFNARTPATKKKYRERDKELRKELADLLERDGFKPEATRLMASWDPYDQNKFAGFFDSEWMFGLQKGFDVVIGNPPYISIANLPAKDIAELSKQNYETFSRGADLYCLFYERGLNLASPNEILTFISSNRFCFTNYGDGLRDYLSKRNILELINFNEINVFESANVGSIVVVIQNAKPDSNPILIFEAKGEDATSRIHAEKKYSSKDYYQKDQWSFDENHIQKLKKEIESKGVPFIQWKGITINRGITTGANNIFIIDEEKKKELIKEDSTSKEILHPVLRGANIKRYFISKPNQYLVYTYTDIKIQNYPAVYNYLKKHRAELEEVYEAKHGQKKWYELRKCSYYEKFSMKKLVWTRLSNQNAFSISINGEFTVDSSSFAVGENLEFLSAILNSKVVFFYFKLGSVIWGKDGIKWFGQHFDNIPIPQISKEEQKPYENLANYILLAYKLLNSESNRELIAKQFEEVIDAMVYELYFPESIKVANAEVIELVKKQIPDISGIKSEEEKLKIIEKVYKELSNPEHPVSIAMQKMLEVEEVKIIEGQN